MAKQTFRIIFDDVGWRIGGDLGDFQRVAACLMLNPELVTPRRPGTVLEVSLPSKRELYIRLRLKGINPHEGVFSIDS